MSKVMQVSLMEIATRAGHKRMLQDIKQMGIENGEQIFQVVIMSPTQLNNMNMIANGADLFIQKTRLLVGEVLSELENVQAGGDILELDRAIKQLRDFVAEGKESGDDDQQRLF